MDGDAPFWKTTPLAEMTPAEWESLCDGCGRCCLVKIEDEDTAQVHFTDVRCRLLDGASCRCMDYPRRQERVPDCVLLTPEKVGALDWLPVTCAYRLVERGQDLAWWHPLVSGDPSTVARAGISAAGRTACSEDDIAEEDWPDRIVTWPDRWPKKARKPR